MVTGFDKAIAGVVAPLVVFVLARFGFNADAEFSAYLAAVISGLAVYLVPNKA